MGYNYSEFWKKSGKSYKKKFKHTQPFITQERQFLDTLKKLQFDSVFELGCGFGRMTGIVMDNFNISKYDAIDISKHQIKNNKVKGVNFEVADFVNYTPKGKYDLVFASEVLMHIPPPMIEHTISKLLSMSNRYFLNIDAYGKYDNLADHNFIHSYMNLYSNYPTDMINLENGQFMFVVEK